MNRRRVARRFVDPWAGLLLGALVALAVVILLATPGPWQGAVGPAGPGPPRESSPVDVAVFAVTGRAPGRCTAVAWVHVSPAPPRVTAVLVPPSVRGAVPGGGYVPLRRLVTDLDPATAADALAGALGVELQGWVVVGDAALDRLFGAEAPAEAGRELVMRVRSARAAFAQVPRDVAGLRLQHRALAGALRVARGADVKANAVVNYLLGSVDVRSDLDLRSATSVVQAFLSSDAPPVAVRTAAAVVERCGPARQWRLDESRLERLRLSLALGLAPPPAPPRVATRTRAAEVLVVAPAGPGGVALADGVEAALTAQGALPVEVRARPVVGAGAGERLAALLARRRPLAVVLAPWPASEQPVAASAEPVATPEEIAVTPEEIAVTTEELAAVAETLRRAWQPAVLVGPPAGADEELRAAALATGVPMVDVEPDVAAEGVAVTLPARLVAAATARACWPAYLAPDLAGTRLDFSFAARRATRLCVIGDLGAKATAWLQACGYVLSAPEGSGWTPSPGTTVAHHPGARRAAFAVAGDLGLDPAGVTRDATAPSVVTVVALSP